MSLRTRACCCLGFIASGYALAFSCLPLKLPSVCMFKRATGCPCMGCNMTHAFCAIARGDLVQATAFHIASVPLAIVVAGAAILLAAEAITNRPYFGPVWKKTSSVIVYGAMILVFAGWMVNIAAHFAGHDPAPHALAFVSH